jgi:hypothetical protein
MIVVFYMWLGLLYLRLQLKGYLPPFRSAFAPLPFNFAFRAFCVSSSRLRLALAWAAATAGSTGAGLKKPSW